LRVRQPARPHRRGVRPARRARPGAEPGHLRARLPADDDGLLAGRPPASGDDDQALFGRGPGLPRAPFGLPVTPTALDAYLEILGDCPVPWAVSAVGGDLGRSSVVEPALARGGHLHLGLE